MIHFEAQQMKYRLVAILALGVFTSCHGQEGVSDSLISDSDSLKKFEIPFQFGIYLEAALVAAPMPDEFGLSSQWGAGVSYERWSAGVFSYHLESSFTYQLIFPNDYTLKYKYGGGYISFSALKKQHFEAQIRLNYARGDMVWEQKDTHLDFLRDDFEILAPEILVGYTPIKYAMIFINLGYRKVYHLELSEIDQGDFSGLNVGIGLRIGFYN